MCNKRQDLQENTWKWNHSYSWKRDMWPSIFFSHLPCFPTFPMDNQICFCGRSTHAVILYFDSNKWILGNLTVFIIRGSFWVITQPVVCPLHKLVGGTLDDHTQLWYLTASRPSSAQHFLFLLSQQPYSPPPPLSEMCHFIPKSLHLYCL